MKKFLTILALLLLPAFAYAQLTTQQGGTGTTSPSGILYGDGTLHLKTLGIGANCTFAGGIFNCSGSGSSSFGTTSLSAVAPLQYSQSPLAQFSITQSGTGTNGYLSSTDFTTFNNKISSTSLSVTTIGTSGAATYTPATGVFNIPQYQAGGNYITALTGDVTASGPGSVAATLATVNGNVGTFTYPSVTVNGKGLITAISNGTAPTIYTGSFPISVSGSVISSLFSTTTNNGMLVGFLYSGSGGIWQTAASSSFFGYTPLNPTRQLTFNGTASQITSSATAQDLSADRTWTFSLPNHVIFPSNFQVTNATTTNATTTGSQYFTGITASRPLYVDSTGKLGSAGSGTSGNCVQWAVNNTLGDAGAACGAGGGGAAFPFTPLTNFGVNTSATGTPIWAQQGIFASTTSRIASTTFAINGYIGIGSSSPTSVLTLVQSDPSALFTAFTIDGVTAGAGAEMALNRGSNTGTEEANIDFDTNGVEEWQLGEQNNNTSDFELWDGNDNPVFTINKSSLDTNIGTSSCGNTIEFCVWGDSTAGDSIMAAMTVSSTTAFIVKNNGNVGIGGTTTPNFPLTITQKAGLNTVAFQIDGVAAGAGGGAEMALNRDTSASSEANIDFDTNGTEFWQLGMQDNSSNDFELWDGNDRPVFTVNTATNRIGFGTTTPFGDFAINAEYGDVLPGNLVFNIASSSLTATTSLFTVNNVGAITTQLGSGFVKSTGANSALSIDTNTYLTSAVTSVSGTANQITSSGGNTPTLSLPNHVIFPNEFLAVLSSTTNATTTGSAYFTGITASRPLYVDSTGKLSSAGTGTSGNCVNWGANNTLGDFGSACGGGAGGTYPFTPSTDGGLNTSATSTPIQIAKTGLGFDVSAGGWYGIAGQTFAYGSTTNNVTLLGFNAGGNAATTTGGNQETAIGYSALSLNTSGSRNTAVGYQALKLPTTVSDNTAVGASALSGSVTGGNNTAVGVSTFGTLTSGTFNTAVGYNSDQNSFVTGANNSFFGARSGWGLTSGSDNIVIGAASSSPNVLTTGKQNIVIGANLTLPAGSTGNGQLTIGNLIFGTGLGATGANVSTGNIGIGTTTPYATFSVFTGNSFVAQAATTLFAIGSSTAGTATTTHFSVTSAGAVFAPNTVTSGSSQTGYWCYDGSGQLIRDTAVCLVSAARYKQNIIPIASNEALAEVLKLQPVSFYYKPDFNGPFQGNPNYSSEQVGFTADQVQTVDPRLVVVETATTTFEGKTYPPGAVQTVRYDQMAAVLAGAIQQLNTKIENIQVGKVARSVEENWQWFAIGLLALWNITLTVRRRK